MDASDMAKIRSMKGKSEAEKKKIMKTITKDKPHMVKGSQAAKEHMAKLRAMRK
jgi:hypothetical protein